MNMYILNKNQFKMPVNTKCGYCGVQGHDIGVCNSLQQLCTVIQSRALDVFTSNIDWSVNSRARIFNEHLKNNRNYLVKDLRFILVKMGCSTNGTKQSLAARIVHQHFYLQLALRQLPHLLSFNDTLHISEYINYWFNISNGLSLDQANRQLDSYFDFIREIDILEIDNTNFHQYNNSVIKFPIKVFMELVDLTDENEKPPTFECAICMEDECSVLDKVDIGCKHSFCKQCVTNVILDSQAKRKHPCCALCRSDYKTMHVRMHNVLEDFNHRFCLL